MIRIVDLTRSWGSESARDPATARENFGRILAAYGGVFGAGSLAWGMALDGSRSHRYDIGGALISLLGVAVMGLLHGRERWIGRGEAVVALFYVAQRGEDAALEMRRPRA